MTPNPPNNSLLAFKILAIEEFIDWLYDQGPDPNTIKREDLLRRYAQYRDDQTVQTYVSPQGQSLAQIINLGEHRRRGKITAPPEFTAYLEPPPDEPA